MDREDLAQYRSLKKELDHLKRRIKRLDRAKVSDVVKASNPNFPYEVRTIHLEGEASTGHKARLEKILKRRVRLVQEMALEIEDFIAGIEDSQVRMVFERRYINGWPWGRISLEMGSVHESYARKIHDRYLDG